MEGISGGPLAQPQRRVSTPVQVLGGADKLPQGLQENPTSEAAVWIRKLESAAYNPHSLVQVLPPGGTGT